MIAKNVEWSSVTLEELDAVRELLDTLTPDDDVAARVVDSCEGLADYIYDNDIDTIKDTVLTLKTTVSTEKFKVSLSDGIKKVYAAFKEYIITKLEASLKNTAPMYISINNAITNYRESSSPYPKKDAYIDGCTHLVWSERMNAHLAIMSYIVARDNTVTPEEMMEFMTNRLLKLGITIVNGILVGWKSVPLRPMDAYKLTAGGWGVYGNRDAISTYMEYRANINTGSAIKNSILKKYILTDTTVDTTLIEQLASICAAYFEFANNDMDVLINVLAHVLESYTVDKEKI